MSVRGIKQRSGLSLPVSVPPSRCAANDKCNHVRSYLIVFIYYTLLIDNCKDIYNMLKKIFQKVHSDTFENSGIAYKSPFDKTHIYILLDIFDFSINIF